MTRDNEILQFLHYHPGSSRNEIETGMNLPESPAAGTYNDGTEYRHIFSERLPREIHRARLNPLQRCQRHIGVPDGIKLSSPGTL